MGAFAREYIISWKFAKIYIIYTYILIFTPKVAIILYVRFYHVKHVIELNNDPNQDRVKIAKLNKVSFILGLISAFGVTLVGNFQVII